MIKTKLKIWIVMVMAALCFPSMVLGAEVVQGKCTEMNPELKIITIQLYDLSIDAQNPYGTPTNETITIDISKSLIGLEPAIGDIVRVAFTRSANSNQAIRLMNITKQGLLNK